MEDSEVDEFFLRKKKRRKQVPKREPIPDELQPEVSQPPLPSLLETELWQETLQQSAVFSINDSDSEIDNDQKTAWAKCSPKKKRRNRSLTPPPTCTSVEVDTAVTEWTIESAAASDGIPNRERVAVAAAAAADESRDSCSDGKVVQLKVIINYPDTDATDKVKFNVRTSSKFQIVLNSLADQLGISINELVLVYCSVELSPFSTPSSVGIESKATIDAYLRSHFEDLKEKIEQERIRKIIELTEKVDDELDVVQDGAELITIKLKDNLHPDPLRLRVATSTQISAIQNMYKDQRKCVGSVSLRMEGETLNPESTIEDCDIDNDDMLEVKIKG